MKKILIILAGGILFSCKNTSKQEVAKKQESTIKLTKLEQLYLLPKDSIYEFYDLSNDSIKEFPDLSEYVIKKLDLSYNQIDSLIQDRLPKNIKNLNLSNNRFEGYLKIKRSDLMLKELNLAYNNIVDCRINLDTISKIILNNNNLKIIEFFGYTQYIDISNNIELENIVAFNPKKVDTIIRDNIANKKPLIYYFHRSFTID